MRRCVQALQEEEPLWAAIHRNVYGGDDDKEAAAKLLTAYVLRCGAPSRLPHERLSPMHASDSVPVARERFRRCLHSADKS